MQLEEINAPPARRSEPVDCKAEPDSAALRAEQSRALIALAPTGAASERQSGHRHAPFVAHLLAVKDQHPQTRERRRADPDEALAAYRATAALAVSH